MQAWNEDAFVNKLFPDEGQNDINTSCSTRYIYESYEIRTSRLAAESFLVLAGTLFNIIVCLLNLKHSSINAAVRIYLQNMAIADTGVLLIGFPFAVAKEQEGTSKWVLGGVACRYIYPVVDVFYAVTVWTMVAIALERCHIMKGDSRSWNKGPSRGLRTVLILWITAFSTISIPLFVSSHYKSACGRKYCFIRWPTASDRNSIPPKLHSCFFLFSLVILPVVIILVSCCRVAFGYRHPGMYGNTADGGSMRQRLRSDNSENSEQDEIRQQECNNAKRFLTPLVILFVISTIPMLVLRSIFIFSPQKLSLEHYLVLFNLSIMLTVCNSAIRPCVYYMVSQDVRDGYSLLVNKVKKRLRMCCRKHDETTIPLQDVTLTRHSCYKETTL